MCTVDLEEFGEEALARNLEDLSWLEQVARAHNDVVWAVAEQATVAPMRLVTICTDDASVRGHVDAHHDGLVQALDSVEGRREWSVKVLVAPREPEPERDEAPVTSGAAYLMRKSEQAERRRSAERGRGGHGRPGARRPGRGVVASRRLAPQDARLTGRTETMMLNAAYLVPDERARRLPGPGATGPRGRARRPARGRRPLAAVLLRGAGVSDDDLTAPHPGHHDGLDASSAPRRSRWSTCSTGCSAPAWCSPATS